MYSGRNDQIFNTTAIYNANPLILLAKINLDN